MMINKPVYVSLEGGRFFELAELICVCVPHSNIEGKKVELERLIINEM